jgi:hypothetical protein
MRGCSFVFNPLAIQGRALGVLLKSPAALARQCVVAGAFLIRSTSISEVIYAG